MRIIKWIFGVLFLIVSVAIVIAGYIAITFDPNAYKERIVQAVKSETGRDLSLNGELSTTFYPWLGISVNDAELSNAQGFAAEQFLTVDAASIRLQLMPLLKKNIVSDRILLKGVEVWLERDAKGVTNWDDILERLNADNKDETESAGRDITGSIAGLGIEDANLHWKDAKEGQDLNVMVKRFETGELKPDSETTIDGEFHFDLKDPVIQGQAVVSGITRLSSTEPFILKQPKISLDIQGVDAQAENIHATVDVSEVRYQAGTLTLNNPDIDYEVRNMPSLGERASGNIKGSQLQVKDGSITLPKAIVSLDLKGSALPGDSLKANLETEQFNVQNKRVSLQAFNADALFTGEPWPHNELQSKVKGASLTLDLDKDTVSLPEFASQVLGLNMTGSLSGTNISKDALSLSGKIDLAEFSPKVIAPKLDIDLPEMSKDAWTQASLRGNYKATKNSLAMTDLNTLIDGTVWTGKAAIDDINNKKVSFDLSAASLDANRLMPPKQADALKDKDGDAASKAAVNAIKIPQEPLRTWDAQGTLRLGTLMVGNIVTTNLEAGINLLDGKLRVFPSKANFFKGQYSGDIRLDVSGAVPLLQADEKITNIDLDEMGQAMWNKSYMTGRTDGRIVLETSGATVGSMREQAKGTVEFKVSDGVMQGFDLNYAVANAVSVFRSKSLSDVANTKQTAFKSLSASATVDNGLLQNEDFLAVMPRMRIRGKGQLNLIDTSINYQVSADVLESKSAALDTDKEMSLNELVGATIPIKITGTLAEPKIRPDVGGYLKSKVEQEIRDRAKKEIEDKLKDKVGGKLGDVLGGILGGTPPATTTEEDTTSADKPESTDEPKAVDPEKATPEEEVPELDPVEQKKKELEQKAKDKLKDIFGG